MSTNPTSSSTFHPFDLAGRDVWVIGGAGYLGQSVVATLVQLGTSVLCADLGSRAEEFVRQGSLAGAVTPVSLDLRDGSKTLDFVAEYCERRGVPHGLVVMTYGASGKPMSELTTEDFDAANQSNLTATFILARALGERMAARGSGSIVLFSSMYGTVSPDPRIYAAPMNPNPIEYGVGKAGIQQMARYLAVQWGPRGVRVNSISPGPFPNPNLQRENAAFIGSLAARVPLSRVGQAPEIAGPVAFLLSEAASFVTGHDLAVDGGWTAW